jgi:hypothetical protein
MNRGGSDREHIPEFHRIRTSMTRTIRFPSVVNIKGCPSHCPGAKRNGHQTICFSPRVFYCNVINGVRNDRDMFKSCAGHWCSNSMEFWYMFPVTTTPVHSSNNFIIHSCYGDSSVVGNRRGKVLIHINGFKYQKNRQRTESMYWHCWRKNAGQI